MPPDDATRIIALYGAKMVDKMPANVFILACKLSEKVNGKTDISWTPYTKEAWKELNK